MDQERRRALDWLLIALAVVPFLFFAHYWNFLCDDAFISFRYAENLVDGHGLRYNINESPPVEGYSNFLWVVLLASLLKLGASPLAASRAVSVICGVIVVGAVYWACRRTLSLDRLQSFVGALSCALLPPFAVWATGGLETMLFTLCFFMLFMTLIGAGEPFPLRRASLWGLPLLLMRPEGVGYCILLGMIAALYYRLSGRSGNWRRGMLAWGAFVLAVMLALTAWRAAYFHAFLPNTVYAKVGFTANQLVRGAYYVMHFFFAFAGAALVLAAAAVSLRSKHRRDAVLPVSVLAAVFIVIQALLGGDFMAMARFMVPLVPLLGMLLAATLCPRARSLGNPRGAALLLLTCASLGLNLLPAFDLHATPDAWREAIHFRWNNEYYMSEKEYWKRMKINTEQWTIIGRLLGSISKPDQSIVTGGIGAIGYYSKMRVYDTYGLVNRDVARSEMPRDDMSAGHDKSVDAFYFYTYRPDYFDPRLVPLEDLENWKVILVRSILQRSKSQSRSNLRENFSRFQDDYTIYTHPVSYEFEGEPMIFISYRLKETMPAMETPSE